MAENLLTLRNSQSSLLFLPEQPTFSSLRQRSQARPSRLRFCLPRTPICCNLSARPNRSKGLKAPGVLSADSRTSEGIFTVDSEGKGISVEPDATSGGGFGDLGGSGGGGGGGGGGGDGGGEGKGKGEGGSSEGNSEKKPGMSMSQKLTLGYAALVGVGGVMGYMKSGSQKSLAAGGLSAAVLYYVYTQLPSNPVFASSIGLGISAALLGVMGLRFKKSGKIFPAGVVSVVSLVMTAGYMHGILRSVH